MDHPNGDDPNEVGGEAPAIDLDHVHEDMHQSLSGESIDDEDELRLSWSDLSTTYEELAPARGAKTDQLTPDLGSCDLVVQYAVHVAQGDGVFEETENKGVLHGEQSYEIVILDEFEFGLDEHRKQYEIQLDPNALATGSQDLESGLRCELRVSGDGTIQLLKPEGIRVDVHPVLRHNDGSRGSIRIHDGIPEEAASVVLPYDPDLITDEFAEYMLGIGLTDESSKSYAFTVYVAIKLQP